MIRRRATAAPVAVERRGARARRRDLERRESVSGHLRIALQLLYGLQAHTSSDEEARDNLKAGLDHLWLALAEIERPIRAR